MEQSFMQLVLRQAATNIASGLLETSLLRCRVRDRERINLTLILTLSLILKIWPKNPLLHPPILVMLQAVVTC